MRPRPRYLHEKVYRARGDMENASKECHGDLFADRTSAATMRANQLRLRLASMAYVLLCALRRLGLKHTQPACAACGTTRLAFLKIGAQVTVSHRRIRIAKASGVPTRTSSRAPTPCSRPPAAVEPDCIQPTSSSRNAAQRPAPQTVLEDPLHIAGVRAAFSLASQVSRPTSQEFRGPQGLMRPLAFRLAWSRPDFSLCGVEERTDVSAVVVKVGCE